MSSDAGFPVMDLDTSFFEDVKVRRLIRYAPARASTGVMAYMACATASWRNGRRLDIEETWPSGITFDPLAVEALRHVGLIDRRGFIPPKTWRAWFEKARDRRDKSRADWREYQRRKRESQGGVSPESGWSQGVPPVRPPVLPDVEEERVGSKARQGLSVENEPTPIRRPAKPVMA